MLQGMYYMMDVCHLVKGKMLQCAERVISQAMRYSQGSKLPNDEIQIAPLPPLATLITPALCKDEHPAGAPLSPRAAWLRNSEQHA